MTTQTVSHAVEKRDQGAAELVRQSRPWFATIVPSHVDAQAFVALTIGYLRRQPKLAAAAARNPDSFMAALSECARLGLVPGDTYHLVPFENKREGTVEITGITDYTGEIELMYRAGAVASVKAEIVCARDHFAYNTGMDRPDHQPDWFGDRGPLIGAYAYAVMKDGAVSKVVVYSKAEIDRVRNVSRASERDDNPWVKWYDRMALKTVLHRLEHFVPTSAEYRREQLRAAAEIAQQVNAAPVTTAHAQAAGEPVDAEIVEEPKQEQRRRPGKGELAERDALTRLVRTVPLGSDDEAEDMLRWLSGTEVLPPDQGALSFMPREKLQPVTAFIQEALTESQGDCEQAASWMWARYHDAHQAQQENADA